MSYLTPGDERRAAAWLAAFVGSDTEGCRALEAEGSIAALAVAKAALAVLVPPGGEDQAAAALRAHVRGLAEAEHNDSDGAGGAR